MEDPDKKNQARDALIEMVWRDMHEKVSRAHVSEMVSEVSEKFHDAKITTYIPIIVRRMTCERLREELRVS